MAFYIDVKYLNIVSSRLEGFTQKNQELWNCRCPICNDSQKKKSKKRGFFYKKGNDLFYRCFNCGYSTTFYKFLQFIDANLSKEYQLERYTNGETKQQNYKKPEFNFKKPVFKKLQTDIILPSISSLSEHDKAKKYVLERRIPKGYHKDLYFAENFKKFVSEIYPEYEKELIDNDPRLIIPFRNEKGDLMMFQGRSLNGNKLRYITVKMNEEYPKIYGLDRLDKKERIYIVEAPLDSLFLKNSIAVADSNLEYGIKYFQETNLDVVLVPDKEPRNKEICKNIEKFIDRGYKVSLLPDSMNGKDLNEFVTNGMSKPELKRIIDEFTFSDLRAKIEFSKWKKC